MVGEFINGRYWAVVPCITKQIHGETWRVSAYEGTCSLRHADEFEHSADVFIIATPDPVDHHDVLTSPTLDEIVGVGFSYE